MAAPKIDETALRAAFREARSGFLSVAVFSFFLNLLMLVSPIYMMQVFDRVLSSGRIETLIMLTVIAAFAVLVLGILDTVRKRVLARIATWLDQRLSAELISASVTGQLRGLSLGSEPLRDLGSVRSFINGQGVFPLFDAPWVPIFLLVIWAMNPLLGILAVVAAIILFMLAIANEVTTRNPLKRASQVQVVAFSQAESTIRNADVVQAMGMLPPLLKKWDAQNEVALSEQLVASDRAGALGGATKFIRMFVQIAILGVGAYLVLRGELTGGGMIAGSILLGRALAPVEQAIGGWKGFITARQSFARLEKLLMNLPQRTDTMPLPAPAGHLEVDRVSFIPPRSDKPILKNVSFALEPGEALGVIGPSAAGKSTLCRLLVGTWRPTNGHVRLDAADMWAWNPNDLGQHVGYLPQDVELFAGTVRDNISRMREASSDEIVSTAALAGVHELILHLPEGYETQIGPYGATLSGGQRQRIGLARALFGSPRVVVLDEPNANLDHDGEVALIKALKAMKERGSTIVLVAHRPSMVSFVDKLLLMRDGQVEMFGPRDQVAENLQARSRSASRPISQEAKPQISAAASQRHG